MTNGAKYKLSDAEKSSVQEEIRELLIALAKKRKIVTYTELCELLSVRMHPHSFVFMHLLTQVCIREEAKGHGVLCALVVSKTTGIPGGGYFRGSYTRAVDRGIETDPDDIEAHWKADLDELFAIWAADDDVT
jgi:hypothetical protein